MNGAELTSRTRPARQPDSLARALRHLRNMTFDYLLVMRIAAEETLTDEVIQGKPDLAYLRSQMRAALRQDRISSFCNPAAIMGTLSRLLGEAEV